MSNPQNLGDYKIGYKKPPQTEASKETRFGGKRGNPRGHGFFKVEDTPRAKLEKMITLTDEELEKIRTNPTAPRFEKDIADVMLDPSLKTSEKWKIIKEMIDEIYGLPKQSVEQVNLEPPVPLSPRKQKGKK